ncbi:phosphatase YcdX [uncultured archaeon]|nr:phosphatase YcdX [uncultured archaeon]
MKNQEIARILYEIAEYLQMEGVAFKPQAYRKAGLGLETFDRDIEDLYREEGLKGLKKIPGVGESIAQKIEEYLKTGKIKYYEDFKKKIPASVEALTAVEGVGPRKVKIIFEELGIKNLDELEKAAKEGKIKKLPGFGEKTEKNILEGIAFLKREKGRFLLGEILPTAREVFAKLEKLKEVEKLSMGGSVRRMKDTIGDLDFLAISENPEKVMDLFVSLPGVVRVWEKGATRASVRMLQGFDMDIRVIPKKSYGSALQYFTGSKEHNIHLRKIAIEKGLKLNEYGVFKGKEMVAGEDEEEVYKVLGLNWMAPELRENTGEIEAAIREAQGKPDGLPKLIDYKDIKGDLHYHSRWQESDGTPIEEAALAARDFGYEYIGISEHTKTLKIEHGLDEKQLLHHISEIEKINSRLSQGSGGQLKFRVLSGCEANIMQDGSIDIDDKVLAGLDYVIAGVHSKFKMPMEKMTERIIKAMENPHVDIISHPTGRLIMKREEYQIDVKKILEAARETKTALEINSYPERLDMKDVYIKRAREEGVKMVINTDSHNPSQLHYIEYGISQTRRGWAEKEDIINCWPVEKLLKFFNE